MSTLNRLFILAGALLLLTYHAYAADNAEESSVDPAFASRISSYKQNYLLVYSQNDRHGFEKIYGPVLGSQLKASEVKFQLSFQGKLWENDTFDLGMAYTQQSYWQLYNKPLSSPFRENNFEPELFLKLKNAPGPEGFRTDYRFVFNHQSNGKSDPLSRSWNRLYAEIQLTKPGSEYPQKSPYLLALKTWLRVPEKAADDNNPDITKYYGYWEFNGRYTNGKHRYHLMLRNNLHTKENRGAVQLDWSWNITGEFDSYVQLFHGYGESLIEYNHLNTRIGAGILLTNW